MKESNAISIGYGYEGNSKRAKTVFGDVKIATKGKHPLPQTFILQQG